MSDPTSLQSIEAWLSDLKKLFGKAPVLPGSEDVAAYEEMLRRFIERFEPRDFFETVLMKDLTDATWEAARMGRHKVVLLDRRYRDGHEVTRRKEWAAKKADLAKRIAASKADPLTGPEDALDHLVEECDAILIEPASELDHNRVLEATLAQVEKLTKLEIMAYAKRDMALRQLESYREGLSRRLCLVSNHFISDHANGAAALPAQAPGSTETISTQTPSMESAADAPPVQPQ
jgi:hypothetical protein